MKNLVFAIIAISTTFLVSSAAYSGQLDLLKIESITQTKTEQSLLITVKSWIGCHQEYKGILLEDVTDRITLAETKLEIRSIAKDLEIKCAGADRLVEETVRIRPFNSGYYTFISVNPQ